MLNGKFGPHLRPCQTGPAAIATAEAACSPAVPRSSFSARRNLGPAIAIRPARHAGKMGSGRSRLQKKVGATMGLLKSLFGGAGPQSAADYLDRGIARARQGQHDRAIADFDEATRLNPADARAHQGRGDSYTDKGEYDKAIADHTEAIRLDAASVAAYVGRGQAFHRKGAHDQAIADYSEAIRLDPKNDSAYRYRSVCYLLTGEYDKST